MAFFHSNGTRGPTPAEIRAAALNRKAASQAYVRQRAENSLLDFMSLMWRQVEPAQPMRISWPLEAICQHLEAVSKGQIRNLVINVPPGFTKSLATDVMWPAWEWGPRNRPDLRVLTWSYSDEIVKYNASRCRSLIGSEVYRALWGDRFRINPKRDSISHFENDHRGFKIAATVEGQGTGFRGDRLIVDDPHNVKGADSDAMRQSAVNWFGGTLTSRVRNAGNSIEIIDGMRAEPSATVVIMQRLHRSDISGVIYEMGLPFEKLLIEMEYEGIDHPARRSMYWKASSIGYVDPREKAVTEVNATRAAFFHASSSRASVDAATKWWDEWVDLWARIALDVAKLADAKRYPRSAVEDQKLQMSIKLGGSAVAAQFRQWPGDAGGMLFRRENFQYVDVAPNGERDDARGWDFAASDSPTSDRTACVRLRMDAQGRLYVLAAMAVRKTPAGVEDLIRDTVKADGQTVLQSFPQDPGAAGKAMIHTLARHVLQGQRFMSSPEFKKKTQRAEPFAAQVEHKNVYIVRGPWNTEFVNELVDFPAGLHDDLVDAVARAYDALLKQPVIALPQAPKLFS